MTGPERVLVLFGLEGAAFSYGPWLAAARNHYTARVIDIGGVDGRALTTLAEEQVTSLLADGLGGAVPVLGGWSAGGVLAHDAARIWHERTGVLPAVLMIDSSARTRDDVSAPALLATFLRELSLSLGVDLPQPEDTDRPVTRVLAEAAAVLRRDGVGYQPDADELLARLTAFGAVTRLSCAHRPNPYPGPVHLVEADEEQPKAAAWASLCASLVVTRLAGNHYTVLRRQRHRLADIGRRHLEASGSPAPAGTSNVDGFEVMT